MWGMCFCYLCVFFFQNRAGIAEDTPNRKNHRDRCPVPFFLTFFFLNVQKTPALLAATPAGGTKQAANVQHRSPPPERLIVHRFIRPFSSART